MIRAVMISAFILLSGHAHATLQPPLSRADVSCLTATVHPKGEAAYQNYNVIATEGGLVFHHRDSGQKTIWTACDGLPTTAIEAVIPDPRGGLLLAARGRGVWRLDPKIGALERLSIDPRLTWTTALAWFDGALWAGTVQQGLLRLEVDQPKVRITRPIWRFRKGRVSGLAPNGDGRLLVARDLGGVWALSPDGHSTRLRRGSAQGLLQDPNGQTWVNQGVSLCRLEGRRCVGKRPVPDLSDGEGLQSGHFTSLEVHRGEDGEPSLWASTFANGLIIKDSTDHWRTPHEDSKPPRFINSLLSHRGSLWATTSRGLFRLRGRLWTRFGETQGLPSEHVNSIAADGDGALWIGTSRGVAHLNDQGIKALGVHDGLPYPIVYSVAAQGDLVAVGTAYGLGLKDRAGWRHYRVGHGGLSDDWVNAVHISEEAQVFIGTYDSGVDHVQAGVAQEVEGLEALWVNPNGILRVEGVPGLLVATLGDGLWLREAQGKTCRLDTTRALPSPDVTDAIRHEGALWIATRGGLARWSMDVPLTCP